MTVTCSRVLRPRDDFWILFLVNTLLKAPTFMWKVLSNTPVKSSSMVHEMPSPLLHSQDMFLFTSILSQELCQICLFCNLFSIFFPSYYVKSSWKVSILSSHCPYFVTEFFFFVMKEMRKKLPKTLFQNVLTCVLEVWLFIRSYSLPRELLRTSAKKTVPVLDECKVRWKTG